MSNTPASSYSVTITLDNTTLSTLINENYSLYGFKAVKSGSPGSPTVWFSLPATQLQASVVINWSEQYSAYTSDTTNFAPNDVIIASTTTPIALGDTLNVGQGGIATVTSGGTAEAISIYNTTSTQYTCGISQQTPDGSDNPLCAFPLHGQSEDVIAPIEKILMMFSTQQVKTSTVIEQAYSQCILIDLTSSNQTTVAYDINTGWDTEQNPNAQTLPPAENLVPFLIVSDASLSSAPATRRK